MASQEHLGIIRQGVATWNRWREEIRRNEDLLISPDLSGVDLRQMDLSAANFSDTDLSNADLRGADVSGTTFTGANLSGANLYKMNLSTANLSNAYLSKVDLTAANLSGLNLSGIMTDLSGARLILADLLGANLSGAELTEADLTEAQIGAADLSGAFLTRANLRRANLSGANLNNAYLTGVNLTEADLSNASLKGARLQGALLVNTNLSNANLEGCSVFGVSAWGVTLDGANQTNLRITEDNEPALTVDDLEIAQFIYMILNHKKIRSAIKTMGERAVLILGRFTEERKEVLDAIAEKLRELKYLPILFDFDQVPGRDYTETVLVLAGLSKFIIADITQPKSVPQESQAIIPNFKIPFVRIIQEGEQPWSMSGDFNSFEWVLGPIKYPNKKILIEKLTKIVNLAEDKYKQLTGKKALDTAKGISIEELLS